MEPDADYSWHVGDYAQAIIQLERKNQTTLVCTIHREMCGSGHRPKIKLKASFRVKYKTKK